MTYSYSKRSLDNLSTCEYDLRIIMMAAIKESSVDFGISEGVRTVEKQLEYFLSNPPKTSLDPRDPEQRKKAKHLPNEKGLSEAVDIYAYVPGRPDLSYDIAHLSYIAGVVDSAAKRLYNEGKVSHLVKWGGNWDMDGCIISDQRFNDLPHFELYKP